MIFILLHKMVYRDMYILFNTMDPMMTPPENFLQIINDMAQDLSTTFPEHSVVLSTWTENGFFRLDSEELTTRQLVHVYHHCMML